MRGRCNQTGGPLTSPALAGVRPGAMRSVHLCRGPLLVVRRLGGPLGRSGGERWRGGGWLDQPLSATGARSEFVFGLFAARYPISMRAPIDFVFVSSCWCWNNIKRRGVLAAFIRHRHHLPQCFCSCSLLSALSTQPSQHAAAAEVVERRFQRSGDHV